MGAASTPVFVTIIDPRQGPDDQDSARRVHPDGGWRDLYPLAEDRFLIVRERTLHLMDADGRAESAV